MSKSCVALAIALAAPLVFATTAVDAAIISGTLNGNSADREVAQNGVLGVVNGGEARVGQSTETNDANNGRNGVFVFQLPSLGSQETTFTDATLSLRLVGTAAAGNGNYTLDLYGLGRRATADVLGTDYYEGNTEDATDATRLVDNFITPSTTTGTRSASVAALSAYLTAQYADGAGAGQYVFFRLNPDSATVPDQTPGADLRLGYQIATADNATVGNRPVLTYTADTTPVPEPTSLALLSLGGLAMVRRRRM
ncbi:MAG TPA: PEP-CTERM sorting domain-containing protein [Tepidisphaeraceae bacterium]|nr:PEP-CTERM sorting domain-containing protein [Tepidisphaeraceae bacterium]